MTVERIVFPDVPSYLDSPVTFVCRVQGAMMLAGWDGEAWLYRVHDGNWCSLRRATAEDVIEIQIVAMRGAAA